MFDKIVLTLSQTESFDTSPFESEGESASFEQCRKEEGQVGKPAEQTGQELADVSVT